MCSLENFLEKREETSLKTLPYWADNYLEKRMTAADAMKTIRPGARVFIGSACGAPQALIRALFEASNRLSGIEIVRLMSHETVSLSAIANKTQDFSLSIRSIYLGASGSKTIAKNRRFITPMNMSEAPHLFKSQKLPIDVALVQVSPPDDFGWMSLGVSVDITLAAALSARRVIAQVNEQMPRIMGKTFIHVNDVDVIVEREEELLAIELSSKSDAITRIGEHIARLIEDGSTLQIGLDAASNATAMALSEKNDLGVHSQFLTEDILPLYATGVINNRKKGLNDGKMVASSAIGSKTLYEFLHDNPAVDFHPSDYVNDPLVISRHNRMVTMNVARTMDLTGQVSAEASANTLYAGVSGILDFVRGAKGSKGGKAILMTTSTTPNGEKSRIVPRLRDETVVVPRGDVHYVVTEYGAVNLFGKSLQERAMAMISLAHPSFRDQLLHEAKKDGLISGERTLRDALHGIYPIKLEETIEVDGEKITIRPSKPVDERRIQEHFYGLDKNDVVSRFFHQKTSFARSDVETRSLIDYIQNLTFIGLVGEFGFGRVIAVGEYLLDPNSNIAEVAFSVSKEYQGKRLGRLFLHKLAAAARENGIAGLAAYTSPGNRAMISLFKTLPYKVSTLFEGDTVTLQCRFDELKEEAR
ncbi:MAG: GNAT family N-acetyltransferase [Desulfobacterales bacterium]|nr:GNAT family N-acetyltransferase [Desulfobacterales bacterium]